MLFVRTRAWLALSLVSSMALLGCTHDRLPAHSASAAQGSKTPSSADPSASGAGKSQAKPSTERTFHAPQVLQKTLSNGLVVWSVQVPELAVTHARLIVHAGSAQDEQRTGLAYLTALALAHGNMASDYGTALAHPSEPLGTELTVRVLPEATVFGLQTAAALEPVLGSVLGAFKLQHLRSEDMDSVRRARPAQASWVEAPQMQQFAWSLLQHELFVFGNGPDVLGGTEPTREQMFKHAIPDCLAFAKRYYGPLNATLVLVGPSPAEESFQAAERALGGWTSTAQAQEASARAKPLAERHVLAVDALSAEGPSMVMLGAPADGPSQPAWPALLIASQLVQSPPAAGAEPPAWETCAWGTASERLGLYVRGQFGPFVTCASGPNAAMAPVAQRMLERLKALSEQAPEAEAVKRAREQLLDSLSMRLSSQAELADTLADLASLKQPADTLTLLGTKLQSVGPEAVQAAAKGIHPEQMTVLVVASGGKGMQELGKLGRVQRLELSKGQPTKER